MNTPFDGDTVSYIVLYTDEAVKEISDYQKRREAHITPTGDLAFSIDIATVNLALRNMTGPIEE